MALKLFEFLEPFMIGTLLIKKFLFEKTESIGKLKSEKVNLRARTKFKTIPGKKSLRPHIIPEISLYKRYL